MERRVQFRNNIIHLGCCLLMLIVIRMSIQYASMPRLKVAVNSPYLTQAQGVLYYKNSPFTGYVYENYPNGAQARLMSYVKGREDGVMNYWYPNGILQQERFFDDGKKQGVHKGWWPDGSPRFEYHFKDDEYDGPVKEWFPNGKPYRVFNYHMGHEDGLEQMWWDSGAIRANYVVKDGQQYGLIGRKLCRNVIK